MKQAVIAALVVIMTIAGALSAVAATRVIETSTTLELQFWLAPDLPAAFVSTRQQGDQWTTHDYLVALHESPEDDGLLVSDPVSLSVPVTFEVDEVRQPVFVVGAAATPFLPPGEPPSGRATCCSVRGMWDQRSAQSAISREMRAIIKDAKEKFDLTHQGPITLNIAYTTGGLNVRYQDAFGEKLEELPSTCSFQHEQHIFFGPDCRTDEAAIAREWFIRAVQVPYVPVRWVGVATFEYYWLWYVNGERPSVRDDRYRSAIFHEPATDFREGKAHDDLMAAAALFAIETYGSWEDWLTFYEDILAGAELHTAFEATFGVELVRFYTEFEAWAERQRSNMLSLAYGSCLEAAQFIPARSLADGGGFPDFRVPLEFDHDRDGYVCEGFAQFDRGDDLVCIVAGAE